MPGASARRRARSNGYSRIHCFTIEFSNRPRARRVRGDDALRDRPDPPGVVGSPPDYPVLIASGRSSGHARWPPRAGGAAELIETGEKEAASVRTWLGGRLVFPCRDPLARVIATPRSGHRRKILSADAGAAARSPTITPAQGYPMARIPSPCTLLHPSPHGPQREGSRYRSAHDGDGGWGWSVRPGL